MLNFYMRAFVIFFLLLLVCTCKAQNKQTHTKEFLFINENDIYLFMHKDGYYTNGFFFQLSSLAKHKKNKLIHRFSLGQNIYTTGDRRATWSYLAPFDRPYCGYLFARYTHDKFVTENTLFSTSAEIGVTGNLALARQLQEWYHHVLQLFNYPYWQKQIPNSFGFNTNIKYATQVSLTKNEFSKIKLVPIVNVNAGTVFVNAQAGAYLCIGRFEKNSNSSLFNATINYSNARTLHQNELFFYLYPQLIYQAYNATVQGSMFNSKVDAEVFLSSVQPFMFQQTVGLAYTKNRCTTKLELVYQSKEAKSQIKNHGYAGLHFAYRFK
jgi:lipid A 3-O-deacylase